MSRLSVFGKFALLVPPILVGGCETLARERAESGCQDISGIVGREFRFHFLSSSKKALAESTLPQLSQEFRDTVVMGDQLCRAAEAGVLKPDAYERFMNAQLTWIEARALETGVSTPEQLAARRKQAAKDIERVAPPKIDSAIDEASFATLGEGRPSAEALLAAKKEFEKSEAVMASNFTWAPAEPVGELYFAELNANYQVLRTEFDSYRKTNPGPTPEFPPQGPVNVAQGIDRETLGYVSFAFDSADLDEEAKRELVAMLNSAGREGTLRLEGFADPSGAYAYNLDLSKRRAAAVAEFLSANGAARTQVQVGSGRTDRFGSSARQNRRVVIERVIQASEHTVVAQIGDTVADN